MDVAYQGGLDVEVVTYPKWLSISRVQVPCCMKKLIIITILMIYNNTYDIKYRTLCRRRALDRNEKEETVCMRRISGKAFLLSSLLLVYTINV